ncbi:MAG: molybdopterin dinucleotide binding domain-containing protein, partial [Pseudomonadota bacterium]
MSNGMDRARQFLREIKKDPARKLIVVDPRRTETADYADIHLAVHPGRDAWCMAAILGHLVQQKLLPMNWLAEHAAGFETVIAKFQAIPVEAFARFAGLEPALVQETAEVIAQAQSFALEEDIGIQMAPHSTLVTYLNHLVQLMTGNYGKPGAANMTAQMVPIIPIDYSAVDENGYEISRRTLPCTGVPIVSGLFPAIFMADEMLSDSDERPRALIVESSNPVHSLPDANKLRKAIRGLDFSVAIDVAMTETARECDYVLPAPTQYEKWEATFFPRNFPDNYFHLRQPILEPIGDTLPEPEIHARLIEALGVVTPDELAPLQEAAQQGMNAYREALFAEMGNNPGISKYLSYLLYRTLGPTLPAGQQGTAAIWGLCQMFSMKHPTELARAGFEGEQAGSNLFKALVESPTAVVYSESTAEESFQRIPHDQQKLQMLIGELLDEVDTLLDMQPLVQTSDEFPFALVAGARRAYTANCNIRDPRWLKGRDATALTMHPDDAHRLCLEEGSQVRLRTATGEATVDLAFDDRMHPGTLSVPNGQGMDFVSEDGETLDGGVYVNQLTSTAHCDRFIGTPLHKFVPASVTAA